MKLFNIGVTSIHSETEKFKFKFINVFSWIATVIFLFTGINNYTLGDAFSFWILETFALLSSLSLIILSIGKIKFAISYLFVIISIALFYFDSYSGVYSGTYLYYFPLLLAIGNIFDFQTKNDRIVMFGHIFFIVFLVFLNIITDRVWFENHSLNLEQKNQMFIFNVSFSIISLIFFVYVIIHSNIQKVNLLKNLVEEESKLRLMEVEKNRDTEILLAELQHRLKNNLSLLSSLLKIKLENINNSNYHLAFKESIHAIHTVAQANNFQKFDKDSLIVPISAYTHEVNEYWDQLLKEFPVTNTPKLKANECFMNIKQAIPLGLIIHEVISLYWFHCLQSEKAHHLQIEIKPADQKVLVYFSSDIEHLLSLNVTKEMIVHALIEQVDGKLTPISTCKFCIEIEGKITAPMIESKSLYKK